MKMNYYLKWSWGFSHEPHRQGNERDVYLYLVRGDHNKPSLEINIAMFDVPWPGKVADTLNPEIKNKPFPTDEKAIAHVDALLTLTTLEE